MSHAQHDTRVKRRARHGCHAPCVTSMSRAMARSARLRRQARHAPCAPWREARDCGRDVAACRREKRQPLQLGHYIGRSRGDEGQGARGCAAAGGPGAGAWPRALAGSCCGGEAAEGQDAQHRILFPKKMNSIMIIVCPHPAGTRAPRKGPKRSGRGSPQTPAPKTGQTW